MEISKEQRKKRERRERRERERERERREKTKTEMVEVSTSSPTNAMAVAAAARRNVVDGIMGNDPSDNGVILGLVLTQLAVGRDRDRGSSGSSSRGSAGQAKDWFSCSLVCKAWNAAAEEHIFKRVCAVHGWRPPRKPRLGVTQHKAKTTWKQLYAKHACRFCCELGDFGKQLSLSLLLLLLLMFNFADFIFFRFFFLRIFVVDSHKEERDGEELRGAIPGLQQLREGAARTAGSHRGGTHG